MDREDVLIAFTPEGWNQLIKNINSLEVEDAEAVRTFINNYDIERITLHGDRLLKFDYVNMECSDYTAFLDCLYNMDITQYLGLFLEEGADEN